MIEEKLLLIEQRENETTDSEEDGGGNIELDKKKFREQMLAVKERGTSQVKEKLM